MNYRYRAASSDDAFVSTVLPLLGKMEHRVVVSAILDLVPAVGSAVLIEHFQVRVRGTHQRASEIVETMSQMMTIHMSIMRVELKIFQLVGWI